MQITYTVLSIILGIIFLDEHLTFALILGCTLIIISTIILAKDKNIDINEENYNDNFNMINKKRL